MIAGWSDRYRQKQSGNTCAVVAIAVAMSIVTGTMFTEQALLPFFPNTGWHINEMDLPVVGHVYETDGLGVVPWQQALAVNVAGGFSAKASHGSRNELIQNIKNGIPTIVTIALKPEDGWGHALVAVGFDNITGELIFFNPATGNIETESFVLNTEQYNPNKNTYATFDDLWAAENSVIRGGNNAVTVQTASANVPSTSSGSGGGNVASGAHPLFR